MPSDRFYTRMSTISSAGLRWTGKLNIPLYRFSGGRIGGKIAGAPVLLLTTTGRKSGLQRTAPVVYLADGERQIVIGSNAGHRNEPAWSLNLKANPHTSVEVGGNRRDVVARLASPDEKAAVWPKLCAANADYAKYQEKTDRDIPVVILSPASG